MRGFYLTYDYVMRDGWDMLKTIGGIIFRSLVRILLSPLFLVGAIVWIVSAKQKGHNWLWSFGIKDDKNV